MADEYQSLYRKYRPQTPGEVRGQEHVVRALVGAVREGRMAHAYLFCGPRGTGKTSTARILAKMVNCEQGPTPEPCTWSFVMTRPFSSSWKGTRFGGTWPTNVGRATLPHSIDPEAIAGPTPSSALTRRTVWHGSSG